MTVDYPGQAEKCAACGTKIPKDTGSHYEETCEEWWHLACWPAWRRYCSGDVEGPDVALTGPEGEPWHCR